MNWRGIARFLGLFDSTLYGRRLKLGVEERRSEISDEEMGREIFEILCLTRHSGESYVRGSLKGRNIHVQRSRVREILKRIDGIGRALRRRYTIFL